MVYYLLRKGIIQIRACDLQGAGKIFFHLNSGVERAIVVIGGMVGGIFTPNEAGLSLVFIQWPLLFLSIGS